MWTAIFIFLLPFVAFIALFLFIIRRVQKGAAKAAGGGGNRKGNGFAEWDKISRKMPTGEAMYAMMFPDLEPVFKPEGMLEWLAWYQERKRTRQLIRDGRRWHGEVPGFAEASTMAVTAQGKEENSPELVVLQKADGLTLAEFLVEVKDDGRTLLTNNAGVFTLNPEDERKVRFKGNDDRSFAWRGAGQWQLSGNKAMPAMQAQGSDLRLSEGGGAGVAALATGAAVGLMATEVLQAREQAKAQRDAQRRAEREAQRQRDRDNDSNHNHLTTLHTDY
jgi:hypothetical protein